MKTRTKKPAAKAAKPKQSPEEKAAAAEAKAAAAAAKKAAAAEAKAAEAETKKSPEAEENEPAAKYQPTSQTVFEAMLNGHAFHFGQFKETEQGMEKKPATKKELMKIAAQYLENNRTLIHADDLKEPAHLCKILTLVRKAAR